ncbi:hypothetical protein CAJAP_10386 [Camponotus japonicus]
MESYVVENFKGNDFLSQSYSQSIERITGTKDRIFNFQIPKKLLKVREKAWINLFGKYSEEMSDDIELNVDTLEPDEEEIEKQVCEEEYREQRIPMRKPATLVQYWVNTGNQPYNALLDENELSEAGSSLSEKETTLSLSSVSTIINGGNKQKYKNESSCSSVNTAAYILSNANITNKVDTIAIRHSAKCGKNTNSSKNICNKDVKEKVTSGNKIQCVQNENAKISCVTDNDNINTNIPGIELYSMSKEYVASKICDQPVTNIVTSGNTIETNMYLQNYKQIDKMSVLNTSQRSSNAEITDDIVWQFDKTSKQLPENDEDNASNQDKTLEKDNSYEEKESENIVQEVITKDKNLTTFYRKKLFTGRNSPIDLIQTERHSISRLSGTKQSLHPALDSDCMMKRETFLVHKDKSKNLSPFGDTNLGSRKTKRKRRKSSISYKNIDTSKELPNRIKNFTIDSSCKISDHNNSDKQDDILLSECNNTNIFVRNETCKQDSASLNINPTVFLERITPFEQHKSKPMKNNHIMEQSKVHNYRYLNNNKLYTCEVENVELETVDSDESTIIVCQCKTNAQHSSLFSKGSDCSFNLKLNTEDDFSASNTEEKDGKLSSLNNTDLSQNKEYTTLEELSPHVSINEDCTNARSQEIKVIVERLPSSTINSQISNKDDIVWQENVLNESKTLSSNSHGVNKIDNVKFREIKIMLEQLPESVNNNSTNTTMNTNAQHSSLFSKDSDCSFNLKLSTEDDFSASNTEEKDGKLSSLNNTDLSQNKEYTTLEELSPHLSINEDCTNARSQEIKVIVERLPVSTINSQISNKDDIVWQENVLNESKTLSSNSHGVNKIDNVKFREIKIMLERLPESVNNNSTNTTMNTKILDKNDIPQKEILNELKTHSPNSHRINKTDNVKLREVKIILERLPPNICFNDTNIFVHKNIISENTNLHNNKRERRIKKMSKTSCKNIEASTRTVDKVDSGYSLRMHTKSVKYNSPSISDTSDIVAEHQVFDKIKFPNQYKNDNKVRQSDSKHSILNFLSSDEDDFVQLIQHPKKRLKFSTNDKLLSETNITENNSCNNDKYHCNRNLRTIIFSSQKPKKTREAFESIKDRKGSSEIKSSDNTTTSLKMSKNGKFLFTPNKNDNDSESKNLDKQEERASSLNYNINNSNDRHSNAIVKKNGRDYKDDTHDMFFQTKGFYSDSSDCEENNSYTTSRKMFKNSFHQKSQYHKHANFKEFSNGFIGKRYSRRHSSSTSNSSFEEHDVANRIHDIKIGLESISKETRSKRLDNEKFNDTINSTINNTEKNISSCFINDTSIQDTTMQKKLFSSISLEKNTFSSLSKNKQISDKSKNSAAIQQDDVKSTKFLIFQTKTYYDSDSNESL